MPNFFTKNPQKAGEAFLSGFKYVNDKGERNSMSGYNLFKHNEELSKYILSKAKDIIELCNMLNRDNSESAIDTFLTELAKIVNDVYTERTRDGKVIIENLKKSALTEEEGTEFLTYATADIYRVPYKQNQFEKYIIQGLKKLKNFIRKNIDKDSPQVLNCELTIETINSYQSHKECVAVNHEFSKGDDIQAVAIRISKEAPIITYPAIALR